MGLDQGTLSKELLSYLGMNSENPHGRGKKTNHLWLNCEPQTMPNTEWMWAMALTQKALWKSLHQAGWERLSMLPPLKRLKSSKLMHVNIPRPCL